MDKLIHRTLTFLDRLKRGVLLVVLLALTTCSQQGIDYTITLGGDIMLAREGKPIVRTEENPWGVLQDPQALFHNAQQVPDTFFANLESPLGLETKTVQRSSNELNLCSAPEQVKILKQVNLSLVSLANNHRDDCQTNGVFETQRILAENEILSVGPDFIPVYLDTPHGKIAVIAAEDVTKPVDIDSLLLSVKKTSTSARVVIVSMHWGNEYQAGPDARQQELAQQISDAGADIIWGHHPHVLQKMEWLKSTLGKETLVIYSLGNLLSDQWMLEDAQRTAVVRIFFDNAKIVRIQVVPLFSEVSSKSIQVVDDQAKRSKIFERLQLGALSIKGVEIVTE